MRIDRGAFLALCGAIACKVEQAPPLVPVVAVGAMATSNEGVPLPSTEPAAPCDDSVANDMGPVCEGMQDPDKSCGSFDFAREQCDEFVPFLKPRLAQEYTECLRALSPMDLCDGMKAYGCKEKALRDACPGQEVEAYCAAEGQPTGDPEDGCMLWARGLNELGRQTALQTCGFSWSCMEGLRSPAVE
jgi:hypothetical protein